MNVRLNRSQLLQVSVAGDIAHPVAPANPFRIGHDGVARVLPGTGGVVLNRRIGDACVGLAGDHIEPGVALHNNRREIVGPRNGPNNALITYACVGNRATVVSGPCRGQRGLVTGKHGGVNHVLVDFPSSVLERLRIGDRVQIRSHGLGLRLLDFPALTVMNCDPGLLNRWRVRVVGDRLAVGVTHVIPSGLMGSGLGKNTAWRGDYDIQLSDPMAVRRYRLGTLRFGDFVAILGGNTRYGPSVDRSQVTIGVIVHGDSTVSGHGPGVTPLIAGPSARILIFRNPDANLAAACDVRRPAVPRRYQPLAGSRAVLKSPGGSTHLRLDQLSRPGATTRLFMSQG